MQLTVELQVQKLNSPLHNTQTEIPNSRDTLLYEDGRRQNVVEVGIYIYTYIYCFPNTNHPRYPGITHILMHICYE